MKKVFFAVAIATMTIFASCTKGETHVTDAYENSTEQSGAVSITFKSEEPVSRSFFSSSSVAEEWENEINNATIFVFDAAGELIIEKSFSSTEVTAKRCSFILPGIKSGDVCRFHVIANSSVTGVETEKALLALTDGAASTYNGTFDEVTTGSKRNGGFVMTGSTTATMSASAANIGVTIKRTVAKVAVQATLSPTFAQKYSGTVVINKAAISRAASQSLLFAGTSPSPGIMSYAHEQITNESGANYQNLFYIYENPLLSVGSRVVLMLHATYDRDGDLETTTDQKDITYQVELDGKAGGEIVRNGYYRVQATIVGVQGSSVTVSITPSNWETAVTQEVNMGS